MLDVRPRDEYASGHIPGAVSIPLEELEDRLASLPRDAEIVAYTTGSFYADDAPQVTLRRPGRRWHLAKVAVEKYWLKRWYLP